MRGFWIGGLLGILAWVALVLVLSACKSTSVDDTPPGSLPPAFPTTSSSPSAAIFAGPAGTFAAVLPPNNPGIGIARALNWGDSCRPSSGINPVTILPTVGNRALLGSTIAPTVGQTFRCAFLSAADGQGHVDKPCWMIWSLETLATPDDYSRRGFPGCHVALPLDNVCYLPPEGGTIGVFSRRAGEGRVNFEWSFPAEALGRRLYLQAVWVTPGQNTGGMLISLPVELWIGDRQTP